MGILSSIGDFFEDAGDFVEDYGLQVGVGVGVGLLTGNPMAGIAAAGLVQQGVTMHDTEKARERASSTAARVEAENRARERAALIETRQRARQGLSRVQYGGRFFGSRQTAPATPAAITATPSLIARSDLTGLNIINPALGGM